MKWPAIGGLPMSQKRETKEIVIIGAGIAGLATGCYARMNGYRTRIFERHNLPGGLCTSWTRKGFVFDGCLHNLAGSSPSSKLYRVWEELGAAPGWKIINHKEFTRIEDAPGRALTFYTDIDRLEHHLKELSPADAEVIDEYIRAARRFAGLDLMGMLVAGPGDVLKMLPRLPSVMKWMKVTLREFGRRFRDPFLRRAFPCVQYDLPDAPVAVSLAFLTGLHRGDLGWVEGGSLALAQALARRYAELGGEIQYRARVERILVENDRAVGVRLADGTEDRADLVISAADGHATIFGLLEGRYLNDKIRNYYAKPPGRSPMSLQVSLGINRDLSPEPHAMVLFLDEPVTVAGEARDRLDLENYAFDPGFAPPGKTALKVMLETSYDYWRDLMDRGRAEYDAEKERTAAAVIGALARRFPGLGEDVEVIDVATPLTTERVTGNWRGLQAYASSWKDGLLGGGISKTLPGLGNFHMVGQWAGATIGLSTVAVMGRKLVKEICEQDGKRFVTTVG
uniref:NAD(P)/FAD-dependent oxidoreductase n=1 Tax=candidate division WOR-3 bacterium TaxID=2052148 RepID=A0A7V1EIP9_UNCW3